MTSLQEFLELIKVVDDDEAEQADFLVCVRSTIHPGYFDDDEFGHCCRCGHEVRFRPHAPKQPKRICMECLPKEKLQ